RAGHFQAAEAAHVLVEDPAAVREEEADAEVLRFVAVGGLYEHASRHSQVDDEPVRAGWGILQRAHDVLGAAADLDDSRSAQSLLELGRVAANEIGSEDGDMLDPGTQDEAPQVPYDGLDLG